MDIDGMQDVYGDLNDFEKRVKGNRNAYQMRPDQDSSDDEPVVDKSNPV
jgi:hypothetical protein